MHFNTSGFSPDIGEQWRLTADRFREWLQNELFSVNWWVLLTLFSLTAYFWWKKADKKRLPELMLYTAVVIIFIIVLDELGEELSLWYYKVDIFPLFPPMTAMDMSCMPFVYMLVYQRFSTWKSFVIATIIMAAVFVFFIEPVFIWGGVFENLYPWKSMYGLPVYFAIGVASKFIAGLAYRPAEKSPEPKASG